jgi:hypothetical protein
LLITEIYKKYPELTILITKTLLEVDDVFKIKAADISC